MDGLDPLVASGIRCAFRAYEVIRDGAWQTVRDGMPGKADRIRFEGSERPAERSATP